MRDTDWAMLIFAAVGAVIAWQLLRDRRSGRDVLGVAGSPARMVAVLVVSGLVGTLLWTTEATSAEGVVFWACLTTGATVLGCFVVLGIVHVWSWLR